LVRTISYVHGAPPEPESRRFVLDGLRALARRCVIDAPMSCERGCGPGAGIVPTKLCSAR
jgi:hypothetical protein